MTLKILHPASWKDYELIDSGDFEKLERFGPYTLIRPEPQALWSRVLPESDWKRLANARFVREQSDKFRFTDDIKGGWKKTGDMPDSWMMDYHHPAFTLKLRLALTGFGHVGIFPEQGSNWNFIYETISNWKLTSPKVLNIFAYTGAASVVAKAAGAEVVHCDASRPGLNWAKQNMEMNGQQNIRWVYEDAFKFVRRELKRGNRYNGLIMDPPPYGRGPDGEKWSLSEQLDELVRMGQGLLDDKNYFFILSLYAAGLSSIVGLNVAKSYFDVSGAEYGEFFLKSRHGKDLPMGTLLRISRSAKIY